MSVKISQWHGCYDSSWKGVITPASFAHPAKYSRGLIERIFDYCLGCGYLKRGDVVGDSFGGIGTGGITAAYRGLRWVGVELEPRFVGMAQDNFALHQSKWKLLGVPAPTIIQGDSRKFHELVAQVSALVSSPPFQQSGVTDHKDQTKALIGKFKGGGAKFLENYEYGSAPGQIGALKSGEVDGVIGSPPFTQGYQSGGGINKNGYGPDGKDKVGQRTYQGQGGDRSSSNIETLKEGSVQAVVSSPPYAVIAAGAGGLNTKPAKHPGQQSGRSASAASQDTDQRYGKSDGQIAGLKEGGVEGVVTSPPWESNCEGNTKASKFNGYVPDNGKGHYASPEAKRRAAEKADTMCYGDSEGQIGKESGETYWQAMDG